ncbi:hypothetical protein, partial [Pseudomonas gingeri]|uniref:hypothetical protein n=2 Tax=Pseudomonas TaxID=286 RepID=UPI0015A17A46
MASIPEVNNFIQSEPYEKLLAYVSSDLSLKVNPEPIPDVVLMHDVKKFDAAGVSVQDLLEIASEEMYVCQYVRKKLTAIAGSEQEQEGKHQEDEEDKILKVLPYYKNFLNIYLLELYFLREKPHELEGYIKAIRIPNAKKYASQLK